MLQCSSIAIFARLENPHENFLTRSTFRTLQKLSLIARSYKVKSGNHANFSLKSDNNQQQHQYCQTSTETSCKSMMGVEYFKHFIMQCGLHAMIAFNMEVLNKLPTEEITEETLYVSQFLSKQMWLFHLKSELMVQKRKEIDSTSSTEQKDSPFMGDMSCQLIMPHDDYSSDYQTNYHPMVQASERPASSEASWGSKKNMSIDDETFSDALLNSPSLCQSDLMPHFQDIPADDDFCSLVENKLPAMITNSSKDINDSTNYFREFDSDIDTDESLYRNNSNNKCNWSKWPTTYPDNTIFDEKVRKRKHDCDKECFMCKSNDLKSKVMKKTENQPNTSTTTNTDNDNGNSNSNVDFPDIHLPKSQEAEDVMLKSSNNRQLKRSNSVPNLSTSTSDNLNATGAVNINNSTKSPSKFVGNFESLTSSSSKNNRESINNELLQRIHECNPNFFQIVVQICDPNSSNSNFTDCDQNQSSNNNSKDSGNLFSHIDPSMYICDDKFSKQKSSLFFEKLQLGGNNQEIKLPNFKIRRPNNLRLFHQFLRNDNNFAPNSCINKICPHSCCLIRGSSDRCDHNTPDIQPTDDDITLDDDCRSTSRSSSSTEEEELVANKLLETSFYECLTKPGYTLLWDILSEKRFNLLTPACKLLAPRLLLQILESFDEDNIKILFFKGCIENILNSQVKTVHLKLISPIIRLLSSCQDNRYKFRQFLKTKGVVQILLKELIDFKASIQEKLQSFEKDCPTDRSFSDIVDEIVLRLEVLGLVFTEASSFRNSDDELVIESYSRELNEMADIIWQTLIKEMPMSITDVTFSWWLSLYKENSDAFGSSNILHIINDHFPTIPPSKLTLVALELYQCLVRKERNTNPELKSCIDNEFIWQAAVYAENADVSVMAIQINAMLSMENLKESIEQWCFETIDNEEIVGKANLNQRNKSEILSGINNYLSKCVVSLKNGVEILNRITQNPIKDNELMFGTTSATVDNVLITLQRVLNVLHSLLLEFMKYFSFSLTSRILELGEEPHYSWCFIDSNWHWIKPLYPKSQEISITLVMHDKKVLLSFFSHQIFGSLRAEAVHIFVKNSQNSSELTDNSKFCGIVKLYYEGIEIKPENDYKCLQELNISDGSSLIICKCDIKSVDHWKWVLSELSYRSSSTQSFDCYLPNISDSPFNLFKILSNATFFNSLYHEIFKSMINHLYFTDHKGSMSITTKYRLWLLNRHMLEIIYSLSKWRLNEDHLLENLTAINSKESINQLYQLSSPYILILNLRLTQGIIQNRFRNLNSQNFLRIFQENDGLVVFTKLIKEIGDKICLDMECHSFWLLDVLGCILDILNFIVKLETNPTRLCYLQDEQLSKVLFDLSVSLAKKNGVAVTTQSKTQLKSETEIDCLKLLIRLMSSIQSTTTYCIIQDTSVLADWIKMFVIDSHVKQLRQDAVGFLVNICEKNPTMSLVILNAALRNISAASGKCSLISTTTTTKTTDLDSQKTKCFSMKEDSYEHSYFDLLRMLVDYFPNENDAYIVAISTLDMIVKIMDSRIIYEKRPLKIEDSILIGMVKVLRRFTNFLIGSDYRDSNCTVTLNDIVIKVFEWLFRFSDSSKVYNPNEQLFFPMKFVDLETNLLPKFKGNILRRISFELLLDFCQISLNIFQTICDKIVDLHVVRVNSEDSKIFPLEYWPRDDLRDESGFCGIINLGATCYLATTLQHFFMIPDCRRLILETKDPGLKWFSKLQSIFMFLQFSERNGLNPKAFCDAYEMNKQVINTGEQKDMSEFFSDLIGKLETVSNGLKSGIKNLLGGESSSYIISLDCPHQRRIPEEFYFLSLNVNNMTNLQESFAHFVEKDILDGNNKYRCSECNMLVRAEKRTCLTKLPHILCLNIMRYYFDVNTLRREKLNNFFEFPMRLDVEPFMKHSLMAVEPDPGVIGYCKYRLIGITVHSGTSESGHYYSFIKDRTDGKPLYWDEPNIGSDKWYCFNDLKVKPFDPSSIPSECYGGLSGSKRNMESSQLFFSNSDYKTNNAYMLFYERVSTTESAIKESKSLELTVSSNLYSIIDSDNKNFLHDSLLFDLNYFQFLLQFSTNVSRLISRPSNELIVTTNVGKMCASFILEVLLHSREKPELSQWVELLFRIISSCHQTQVWLINFITSKNKLIFQYLFLCPDKIVRNLFIRFIQELVKLILNNSDKSLNSEIAMKNLKQLLNSMIESLELTLSDSNNISSLNVKLNQFEEPILTNMTRPTLVHCGPSTRFYCNNYPEQIENYFDLWISLIRINPEFLLPISFKCGALHRLIAFYLQMRFCDSDSKVCAKQVHGQKYLDLKSLIHSCLSDAQVMKHVENKKLSSLILQFVIQSQADINSTKRGKSYLENFIVIIVEILNHLSQKMCQDQTTFLSKNDASALLSDNFILSNFSLSSDPCQSMPFLYHQIYDNINPLYTLKLLALLIAYRKEILSSIVCFLMLSATVQTDAGRCQNFLYYLDVLLKLEEKLQISSQTSERNEVLSKPIEHIIISRCVDFVLASRCPSQWLSWMCSRCPDPDLMHCLVVQLDDWLYKFLVLDQNSRVRQNARDLIRTLLRTPQESDSESSDDSCYETEIQQKLFRKLLSFLPLIKEKRCFIGKNQSSDWLNLSSSDSNITEPWRQEDQLTAYFNSLSDCMRSQADKIKTNEYLSEIWAIYHPGMSVALCPINWEKQALLAFLCRVCLNNPAALDYLTTNSSVTMHISTNYILSDLDDPSVVLYNKKMLPHFFGVLTLCCQRSPLFRLNICHKCDTIDWCYRHVLPHRQYYGSVIDDMVTLTQSMLEPVTPSMVPGKEEAIISQSKFRRRFLRRYITTELRSKLLLKLCSILIQDNEDRLTLAMHDGFIVLCITSLDLINKYLSNGHPESEKPVIEILSIMTQITRYCLMVIEQNNGTSLRRDIFYRTQSRFKSQMLEMATKLLHLICSDSTRNLRLSSIDCVRQVLDVYQKDFLTIITKELLSYQSKINIESIVNRNVPLATKIISRHKDSTCAAEPTKSVDEKVMLAFFSLVDRVSRMAVNLHRFNSDNMTLSLITAIQSYKMSCPLFAQFCLEVFHSNLIADDSVNHMVTSSLFHDYIYLLLSGEVDRSLQEKAIMQLLEEVFPKVVESLSSSTEFEELVFSIIQLLSEELIHVKLDEKQTNFHSIEHLMTILLLFLRGPLSEGIIAKIKAKFSEPASTDSSTFRSQIDFLFGEGSIAYRQQLSEFTSSLSEDNSANPIQVCSTSSSEVNSSSVENCKVILLYLEKFSQIINLTKS